MKIMEGDYAVGDVGKSITITSATALTGKNIDFVFVKPSGATITRDAVVSATYKATYTFVAGDLSEEGRDWYAYLKNVTDGYELREKQRFTVRPAVEDMAV